MSSRPAVMAEVSLQRRHQPGSLAPPEDFVHKARAPPFPATLGGVTGDPHGRRARRAAKMHAEFRRRRVVALFAIGVGLLAAAGLAQRTTSSHARHLPAARVRARVATRLSNRRTHSAADAAIERLLARVPYIA